MFKRRKKHYAGRIIKDNRITTRAYQRYEVGEREPKLQTLKILALYYKVSLDYIVGLTDVKNK
ncbi:helix-turn-helix domain-containing protein [Megamonas hypermegale]|uniref:helix-turn-helix domain-containing protein n=1 Tax=Megamonas hypermegale TaxID=158847 RepID=UPI0026EC244B|nr:helix-turn-helix transcriptional regulator [Megamonas hypermegale]